MSEFKDALVITPEIFSDMVRAYINTNKGKHVDKVSVYITIPDEYLDIAREGLNKISNRQNLPVAIATWDAE